MRSKRYYPSLWFAALLVPLKRAFGWLDSIDRGSKGASFVRSVYGPYLLNTPGDQTFELCVKGYGPYIADIIRGRKDAFVFLDIGANLGVFSLVAAMNPHCLRVIAFEPLPEIFANLQKNIRRNGADKITPVLGAVADSTEDSVRLSFNPRHSGMSRISADGDVRAEVISSDRLDAHLAGIEHPVIVKIDVEGAEMSVMSCLRKTSFYDRVENIIIEISERNLGAPGRAELLDLLARDGYRELSRAGPDSHYDALYARAMPPGPA